MSACLRSQSIPLVLGQGPSISDGFKSDSDSDDGRVVPIDLSSEGGEVPGSGDEGLRLGDERAGIEEDEATNM
ncbi:hypothetical protein MRB53_005730 [Persea americana]|uniref:Uncharacterized protein n=1 Tax=Persea americana TaxID=3435 RepID=A0ACC2MFS7_PERAE|nr:hypothetical protein MRB53_005730 [Persea americana]